MPVQIGSYLPFQGSAQSLSCYVASNGRRIVTALGSSLPRYWTSADGNTWTAATLLLNVAGGYAGVFVADTLYFTVAGTGASFGLYKSAFSTATNTFAAPTQLSGFLSGTSVAGLAWDSTNSHIHAAVKVSTGGFWLYAFTATGTLVAQRLVFTDVNGSGEPIGLLYTPGATGTGYALLLAGGTTLILCPFTYTSGAYVAGATETVGPAVSFDAALDNAGLVDLVYRTSTNHLMAVKRTGTNTYGAAIDIAAAVASAPVIASDGAGGLDAFYQSTAGQPHGEIYLATRPAGGTSWNPPALVAGGSTAGFQSPQVAATLTASRADVIYVDGTSTFGNLWYLGYAAGSTPTTPVNATPANNVSTLTPSFAFTYANPSPADPQLAYEIKVTLAGVTKWGSGKVTSAATSGIVYGAVSNVADGNYVAPAALAYGSLYTWTVRVWDTVLNAVSSFSTGTTFTPVQPGVATITQVNGASPSPQTLTTPVGLVVTASWTQPQANATSAYTLTIYQADGITPVTSTTGALIIASGASGTTAPWTPLGLANGATYAIAITLTDAVTGLTATSVQWVLTTVWTPPAAPTGLTAVPNTTLGTMVLNWTNAGAAAAVTIYRRVHGTLVWTTLASGTLRTALSDYCPLNTSFDYGVQTSDATGLVSTITAVSGVTLGLKYGKYGFWFNDVAAPSTSSCCLGAMDSYDVGTATQHHEDVLRYVPQGRQKPIASFGLADWWDAITRKYYLPGSDTDGVTTMTNTATLAALTTLSTSHAVCYARSPDGMGRFVTLETLLVWTGESGLDTEVSFDWTEVGYPAAVVVS